MFSHENSVHTSEQDVFIGSNVTGQEQTVAGASCVIQAFGVIRQEVSVRGGQETVFKGSQCGGPLAVGTVDIGGVDESGDRIDLGPRALRRDSRSLLKSRTGEGECLGSGTVGIEVEISGGNRDREVVETVFVGQSDVVI